MRYDGAFITPSEAGANARVSPDTAVKWAKSHGIAYQAGGKGSLWRIHKVGWHLVVEGDLDTLADLRDGRLTPAVEAAFRERSIPVPEMPGEAA